MRPNQEGRDVPLDVIADALPVLVSYVDAQSRYQFNNRAYEEWFGHSRADIRGRHLREVLGEEAFRRVQPHVEAALAGKRAEYEAEIPYRHGGTRYVHAAYIPHRDADGRVAGFIALVTDITQRRRAEQALRRSEQELESRVAERTAELERSQAFQAALERATRAGVAAVDLEGRQTYVNPAFSEMVGWPAEELVGALPPFVYWPPEELSRIDEAFRLTVSGQAPPGGFELRFMRKDGQRVLVHLLLSQLVDEAGRPSGWVASATDITERKRIEESLRRSQAQLAEVQRLAHLGSWEWDVEHNRVSWSDELYRIYGLDQSSFAATFEAFLERVHPEDRAATRAAVERAFTAGEPFAFEERIVRPDGSVRILLSQGKAVTDESGRTVKLIGSCLDITERKRRELERAELASEQAARAEAERLNRLKDEFLATLSHELRTPLNAIVGWSHMLKQGGLDGPTVARAAETIHRNAMLQSQLISDILDIQRISSGRLRLELVPTDVAAAVQAAVDSFRPAAQASAIDLRLAVQASGATVQADAARVQQIVGNLLSNAIKFSPSGSAVDVVVDETPEHIEIRVEDRGPGIPPEFLPYIFDRFRQGDSSSSRRHGGLGLGMAIVRSLAELHGGSVHAENRREGTGAVVRARLPRPAAAPRPAAVRQPLHDAASRDGAEAWTRSAPSLHGRRVLVVDDEPDARELVATVLERCGADVVTAASAAEAMAAIARDRPDVLLSDIEMPGEDGYSLLRRVRALPPERGGLIPAAALTAYAGSQDRASALAAGFQAHVPKPVMPDELVSVVAGLAQDLAGRAAGA